MKNKAALTKELVLLLEKYQVDNYCCASSQALAAKLIQQLEDTARAAIHQR